MACWLLPLWDVINHTLPALLSQLWANPFKIFRLAFQPHLNCMLCCFVLSGPLFWKSLLEYKKRFSSHLFQNFNNKQVRTLEPTARRVEPFSIQNTYAMLLWLGETDISSTSTSHYAEHDRACLLRRKVASKITQFSLPAHNLL